MIKFFTKILSGFPEIGTKVWKMPYHAMSKNVFKKLVDPDMEEDDFQNIVSFL